MVASSACITSAVEVGADVGQGRRRPSPTAVLLCWLHRLMHALQVVVQTNHMGRWQFRLCDLSATDDSKCTQLER